MKMLTVRLSCSIEEFEGGNEAIEAVDCWLVDRGYAPLSDVDDGSATIARFEGALKEADLSALVRFLDTVAWRHPAAVQLERTAARGPVAGAPGIPVTG